MLVKLQKRVCRAIGPSFAASLAYFARVWNIASLSPFHRYYIGRCLSELAELVPLVFSRRRFTHYSNRLNDFSVTIPRCYNDVYVNIFYSGILYLQNALLWPKIQMTLDLELIATFYLWVLSNLLSYMFSIFFLFFFFNSMPSGDCSTLREINPN